MDAPVQLVCMPWGTVRSPSLQLGLVKAILAREGIAAETRYLNLRWLAHVSEATRADPFTVDHYEDVLETSSRVGLGDWVFAGDAFAEHTRATSEAFRECALAASVGEAALARAAGLRPLVASFLDAEAARILSRSPRVVGFGTMPGQLGPSLAMAARLKALDPSVVVVLGGVSCLGPMGAALVRSFPQVDVVVRGEAERVVGPLFRELLGGEPLRPRPGLCHRLDGGVVVVPEAPGNVPMNEVPQPDYDDYFEELAQSGLASELAGGVRLPFEGARGCWWGQKSHCSFCGLNGTGMSFRAKEPRRVRDELVSLARRHRVLDFVAVDNIMDARYPRTLLPELQKARLDLRLFYETKANLTKAQLRSMVEAGVVSINPGIETLSTPILRLMRKGVTALQNVRLLKWGAELGITVLWNLIYGIPREPEDEYATMTDAVRSLFHLAPPALNRLHVDRFSPYHDAPAEHGLRVLGAKPYFGLLYPLRQPELDELAWTFDYEHADGRDPETYVAPLREAVAEWTAAHAASRGGLTYRCGPGFVRISDRRANVESADYTLDQREALVYLACDAGATPAAISRGLGDEGISLSAEDIAAFLDGLVARRLVYREGERYLSLAVSAGTPLGCGRPGAILRRARLSPAATALSRGRALS